MALAIRSPSSPGSITTASRVASSTRIEQLHCSGPTGIVVMRVMISTTPLLRSVERPSRIHRDDGVHVVLFFQGGARPDLLGGGEVQLHGPLVVVRTPALRREERAPAGRREDLPPDVDEVRLVPFGVEGG